MSEKSSRESEKPIIPLRTGDEAILDPSEFENEDRRIAELKSNKPPHHG